MNHYHVKIIDAAGTHLWNIVAMHSIDAGRIALRLTTITGPFFMVTRLAA